MRDFVSDLLKQILERLPVSRWRFADIRRLHPLAEEYPAAIALAVAYRYEKAEYDHAYFEQVLRQSRRQMEEMVQAIDNYLR